MDSINMYLIIGFGAFISLMISIPHLFKIGKELLRKTRYSSMGSSSKIRLVRQLHEAVEELSKNKTGAIITIVNKDALDVFRTDGIKINADISSSLIISIFNKYSPIHDGALIIDNNKITYVGTYYKITNKSINNKFGARHRAAMGISEQTDALTIIVSEETGGITFAINSEFHKTRISDFQENLTSFIS